MACNRTNSPRLRAAQQPAVDCDTPSSARPDRHRNAVQSTRSVSFDLRTARGFQSRPAGSSNARFQPLRTHSHSSVPPDNPHGCTIPDYFVQRRIHWSPVKYRQRMSLPFTINITCLFHLQRCWGSELLRTIVRTWSGLVSRRQSPGRLRRSPRVPARWPGSRARWPRPGRRWLTRSVFGAGGAGDGAVEGSGSFQQAAQG